MPSGSVGKSSNGPRQEHRSGRPATGDGFGGGLGAKAMAAHRQLGIPSALPYTTSVTPGR